MDFYHDKFKDIRERNGVSVKELCRILDVSRTTIWKWENQKVIPSADFVRLLAKALKVNIDEISSLPPEPEHEKISYSAAVESCHSLLDRDSFLQKNDRLKKAIREIISLQDELDQTSIILNALFNEISSIFYIKDINLRYISANKKFLQNLSLHSSYKVYGKDDRDFYPAIEAKENAKIDKNVLQKGKSYYSEGYIPGSRKKRWGIIEKHPISNNEGKITGLICTCKDITEQRKAETENKRLLVEKDILFSAVNSLHRTVVLIYERAKDGKPVYKFISNNIEKILGYTKSYLIENNIFIASLMHENYREKLTEHFLSPSTDFFDTKVQIRKMDGTYIWMEAKAQKREEPNGGFSFLGILTK